MLVLVAGSLIVNIVEVGRSEEFLQVIGLTIRIISLVLGSVHHRDFDDSFQEPLHKANPQYKLVHNVIHSKKKKEPYTTRCGYLCMYVYIQGVAKRVTHL